MRYLPILLLLILSTACNENSGGDPSRAANDTANENRLYLHRDAVAAQTLALGEQIYRQNCAACHGAAGEGDLNWRQRDERGMFPPPPLNGSGHTWHHPMADLMSFIRDGSPPGKGRMPAWKHRLSDTEIQAVIYWLQSQWPDELYEVWLRTQEKAAAGQ